jgi:hypothetical protein
MWLGLLSEVLGEEERADADLGFACEFQEVNGFTLWAARARLGWAEALASRGESARAVEEASRTLELASGRGYQMLERRASALIGAPAVHS